MKTQNLTKTNLCTSVNIAEIEKFIGKEIESVFTIKSGFDGFMIAPGHVVFQNNYPCNMFRPFTMINKNYSFDKINGVLQVSGRNKWKRVITTKKFQLEKIGYKLPTTHLPEGWIWGNPVEIV